VTSTSPPSTAVLLIVVLHLRGLGSEAMPSGGLSLEELAKRARLSERSVSRAVTELERRGVLAVQRRPGGGRESGAGALPSVYRFDADAFARLGFAPLDELLRTTRDALEVAEPSRTMGDAGSQAAVSPPVGGSFQ
jgi:DNA-binding Lrp family transcriptional regulator